MNNFSLSQDFQTNSTPSHLPYQGLKPGQHRRQLHENEVKVDAIVQISTEAFNQGREESKSGRTRSQYVSEFLRKIENMELEIKEIQFIQARCRGTTESQEELVDCRRLQSKYNDIVASTKRALPETAATFASIQKLLEQLKADEELTYLNNEFKKIKKNKWYPSTNESSLEALKGIIKLVLHSLEHGINSYDSFVITTQGCKQKETFSLLELLMRTGLTEWAQGLIYHNKDIYFAYNNVFILAISKSLNNISPRNAELENEFLDIIAAITQNEDPSGLMVSKEYWLKDFQPKLHDFVRKIDKALVISTRLLNRKLSEITEPKRDKVLGLPSMSLEPIFLELELIDDNSPFDCKRKSISSILKEIAATETALHAKMKLITNRTWTLSFKKCEGNFFELLHESGFIDFEFCLQLTKHWEELTKTSNRLVENFKNAKALINQMEACLIAFSPQLIHTHLKHLKFLSGSYIKTDEIIKNCMKTELGQQKLLDFKKTNKTDIVDILIMPVQRAPRYVLLLNELSKQFDSTLMKHALGERINYLQRWIQSINYLVDPNFP